MTNSTSISTSDNLFLISTTTAAAAAGRPELPHGRRATRALSRGRSLSRSSDPFRHRQHEVDAGSHGAREPSSGCQFAARRRGEKEKKRLDRRRRRRRRRPPDAAFCFLATCPSCWFVRTSHAVAKLTGPRGRAHRQCRAQRRHDERHSEEKSSKMRELRGVEGKKKSVERASHFFPFFFGALGHHSRSLSIWKKK